MQLSHRRNYADKRKYLEDDRCSLDGHSSPAVQFLESGLDDLVHSTNDFNHMGGTFSNLSARDGAESDETTAALLEFARENLLLKRELNIANAELSRLQTVVQAHDCQKKGPQYNSEDEPRSQRRYWTDQEHERFLDAIQNFGHKNVKAISAYVGTRSATQVRTHAQKYFLKAARENKAREKASAMIKGWSAANYLFPNPFSVFHNALTRSMQLTHP